jgi:tetratricopeptide (TPR) repeat protein
MSVLSDTEKLLLEAQQSCERGDIHRMLVAADELLRREPDNVDAMFIAGTAFLKAEQYGMAVLTLNAARCATKDPVKLGPIWNNIGCALQEYQPHESYRAFRKSLDYGTPPPATYDNLCNVASTIGRHAEAMDWADRSDHVDPSYNKSFALMHLGRWAEAWREYAKSAGTPTRPLTSRDYDLPRWDGKKPGKVVIHGEQGVGDEIMFMSMCPRDFDGVIECNPRNEGLFARSFPNARVYGTLLQQYLEWPLIEKADYHLEMGGLGEFFAPEPFAGGGFLAADAARCAAWRAWLDATALPGVGGGRGAGEVRYTPKRVRVGIAWTGGAWSTGRLRRSVPFDLIEKLIGQHPDVTWVCLEYEDRRDHLEPHPQVLNPYWATKKGADMDETAALAASLDLVITATQSLVDVCGGLGAPCWAMVDAIPPWRYAEAAGEHQMWFYESVRTFRQKASDNGSWERVVTAVSAALHALKVRGKANGALLEGADAA